MFYLYSTPTCLEHKIHNFLAKVIEFLAKCIGALLIEKSKNGSYTNKNGISRLWCYLTNFTVISFSIYISYISVINHDITSADLYLIAVFRKLAVSSYYMIIIVFLSTVMFQTQSTLKAFNHANELYHIDQLLFKVNQNVRERKRLFYKLLIKIGFDLTLPLTFLVMSINEYHRNPTFLTLVFTTLVPSSLIVYCFIGTIYYVSLAYALFLAQKAHQALKTSSYIPNIATFYHHVVRFVRKINKIIQVTLLLLVFQAFMGLVINVRMKCDVLCY